MQGAIDLLDPVEAGLCGISGRNLASRQLIYKFSNGQLVQHRAGKNPAKTVTDSSPKGKVKFRLRTPVQFGNSHASNVAFHACEPFTFGQHSVRVYAVRSEPGYKPDIYLPCEY